MSAFLDHGHLWGYNPFFHAGFPDGTLFDMDNKGIEVSSWLLSKSTLSLPLSYNLVILLLLLFSPFAIYLAGRALYLSPAEAAFAQALAMFFWFGDPTWSWAWQGGMISFLAASTGAVLCSAAFWRWAFYEDAAILNRWLLIWFLLGGVIFWLHPWVFFILAVPLSIGTLFSWRRWERRKRLLVVLWIGFVLLINSPWWIILLQFLSDKTASEQFLQGGLQQLTLDIKANSSGLRIGIMLLAAVGILSWRNKRLWWAATGVSILALALLAYTGIYIGAGALQPYRFLIPAIAFCTLPAAAGFTRLWQANRSIKIFLPILLIAVAINPSYSGRPRHRLQNDGTPRDYLSGLLPDEKAVCEALRKLDLQAGRVLTNDWRLGAALPACSGAQVIGGPFLWVWTSYGYANAGIDEVFGRNLSTLATQDMAALLDLYNVHWLVVNKEINPQYYTLDRWDSDHPGLFSLQDSFGNFDLYQVVNPTTWFVKGSGQVYAELNQITVKNATQGELILKYHWIESLISDPPLTLTPVYLGSDPQPFIQVENGGVRDFRIYQDYK